MKLLAVRWHTAPPVNGCRWCGDQWGGHGLQFVRGHGLHRWTAPTDAQRKARLKAHIASREAQRQEQPA